MTSTQELANALISWAQNEEMINQYYTEHGKDCLAAAEMLLNMQQEIELLNIIIEDMGGDDW